MSHVYGTTGIAIDAHDRGNGAAGQIHGSSKASQALVQVVIECFTIVVVTTTMHVRARIGCPSWAGIGVQVGICAILQQERLSQWTYRPGGLPRRACTRLRAASEYLTVCELLTASIAPVWFCCQICWCSARIRCMQRLGAVHALLASRE